MFVSVFKIKIFQRFYEYINILYIKYQYVNEKLKVYFLYLILKILMIKE